MSQSPKSTWSVNLDCLIRLENSNKHDSEIQHKNLSDKCTKIDFYDSAKNCENSMVFVCENLTLDVIRLRLKKSNKTRKCKWNCQSMEMLWELTFKWRKSDIHLQIPHLNLLHQGGKIHQFFNIYPKLFELSQRIQQNYHEINILNAWAME